MPETAGGPGTHHHHTDEEQPVILLIRRLIRVLKQRKQHNSRNY
jgi:hypothetical protein